MLKNRRSTTPTRDRFAAATTTTVTATNNNNVTKKKSSVTSIKSTLEPDSSAIILQSPHWSDLSREILFSGSFRVYDSDFLVGGADQGQFPHFGAAPAESAGLIVAPSSSDDGAVKAPCCGDVLLEVAGQKVVGYTLGDVVAWTQHCLMHGPDGTVVARIVPKGRNNIIIFFVILI